MTRTRVSPEILADHSDVTKYDSLAGHCGAAVRHALLLPPIIKRRLLSDLAHLSLLRWLHVPHALRQPHVQLTEWQLLTMVFFVQRYRAIRQVLLALVAAVCMRQCECWEHSVRGR